MTTTRLKIERMGCRETITPRPPSTASTAMTQKTATASTSGLLPARGRSGANVDRLLLGRVGLEQHLLRVDELLAARVGELVFGPQHDRLDRASLLTVAAEDASEHVDLVDLGVALTRADPVLLRVLGGDDQDATHRTGGSAQLATDAAFQPVFVPAQIVAAPVSHRTRSEEHTSELQSRGHLVCRLLLEKKKKKIKHFFFETKKKKKIIK